MNTYRPRWVKTIATAIPLVAVLALVCAAALARDDNRIVLKEGTIIPVTLNTGISSETANPGDTFTATVDTSRSYYGQNLQGATVTGYVKAASPRSGDKPGMLDLAFTRLDLPDGTSYTINGEPTSLDSKFVKTEDDGLLVAKSNGNRGLKFAGIGAGAGALVGVLATGGLSLMDTIVGAGIGYGASTINKPPDTNHNVTLAPGTQMGVLLANKVTYYHRSLPTSYSTVNGTQIGIERDDASRDLPLPMYATSDSTMMDITAACGGDVTINPGSQATISTGLRFSIPVGFEAQIRPSETLAQQDGLVLQNGPMTIDSNDHGVVAVTLYNGGQNAVTIHRGDRIAHLVVTQIVRAQFNPSSF